MKTKPGADHPFERSIGPGPYVFVGVGEIAFSPSFGAKYIGPEVERGAGTCAHCGTGIKNIFAIRAGDGKVYGVGSDCIRKSDLPYDVKTQADKAKRDREKKIRQARAEERRRAAQEKKSSELKALREWWASSPPEQEEFKKIPHPAEYYANMLYTLFHYIEWNLQYGNVTAVQSAIAKAEGRSS
jgi:hypothetical protein